jgi:hypothetical protein
MSCVQQLLLEFVSHCRLELSQLRVDVLRSIADGPGVKAAACPVTDLCRQPVWELLVGEEAHFLEFR